MALGLYIAFSMHVRHCFPEPHIACSCYGLHSWAYRLQPHALRINASNWASFNKQVLGPGKGLLTAHCRDIVGGGCPRDALEGKGLQRGLQRRLIGGWRRLPNRLGAVTVGYKCHGAWYLPPGRQWLGTGWAPWRGGDPFPPFQCIPRVPPTPLYDEMTMTKFGGPILTFEKKRFLAPATNISAFSTFHRSL